MFGNWLEQIGAVTIMNLRNVRERLGLDARRARRRRRRRHGRRRRAVDQRRLPRRAARLRRRRRRDRAARRLHGRDDERLLAGRDARDRGRRADRRRRCGVVGALRDHRRADEEHRHACQRADARRRPEAPRVCAKTSRSSRAACSRRARSRSSSAAARRQQFAGLAVGETLRAGTTSWAVVGHFRDRGSVAESELWTDAAVLQGAYNRGNSYQSVRARLTSAQAVQGFKDTLTADPRLNVRVFTERQYYEEQSRTMTALVGDGRRRDRRAHGLGRRLRGRQHDVLGGVGARARDRDAARARLRRVPRRRVRARRGGADRARRRRHRHGDCVLRVQRPAGVDAEFHARSARSRLRSR